MEDRSKSDVDRGKKLTLQKEIQAFLSINLDILCVTDLKGNFLGINKRFQEVLGYTGDEINGRSCLSFIHEEDIFETTEVIKQSIDINALAEFTNRCLCKNGTYKYMEWHTQPYFSNFFYASARDITEKKEIEEQLMKTAVRDELTGLYNRHYFEIAIGKHTEYADRSDEPLCMMIFDLDHFKSVNDTWGHPVGDDLLKTTARIIDQCVRKSDILVRFGGEEFLAVLPNTTLEEACLVANKIRLAIGNY
ncbi:MAG: diguanylate cyclase with sensor, partial [Firmicutes bacterium]|nr:diguanylate cyclase with sensor [Bacillota bacterium]